MNSFVNAVKNQDARTANGMLARKSTASACVDLFFKAGASRGKDITKDFVAAYVENKEVALRIAQWLRDARGGAGERELFRQIMTYLDKHDQAAAAQLLMKVPEIGRWDDIFVVKNDKLKYQAYSMLGDALRAKNGLAAKWTPRKGEVAVEVRNFFGMSPKFYRKSLVELSKTVEQEMCAGKWDEINFSHVPSVAHARYKKAFFRNTQEYAKYVAELVKDPKDRSMNVKINAGAVYPYDVLKGLIGSYRSNYNATEANAVQAQWDAMENFIGDANVLPLVDVSGSMTCKAGGAGSKSETTCLDVAVSLGLYCADKNKGKFKDTFLTFSRTPKLVNLKGNINQKIDQMNTGEVANTDLNKAFELILKTATDNNVPQAEMPQTLVIFSDMQFDQGCTHDDSAIEMIARKYEQAGYTIPKVVFWNLNAAYGNTPVSFDKKGTALVSGFSPAVAGGIMGGNMDDFTPEAIMLKTVMKPRYDLA